MVFLYTKQLFMMCLSGEQFQQASLNIGDAFLDIAANGFLEVNVRRPFLDLNIFISYAASNHSSTSRTVYRSDENMKKH